MSDEPIEFTERDAPNGAKVAFARLNAERALNALSQTMIDTLQTKLESWARRSDVACVVIHGAGEKAFCAGGDVIGLYKAMTASPGHSPEAERFFAHEYRLDHTVHRYPKPVLCWGHGTVMGGGLGVMAGASHRVVTETSRIAMPEVTIGLFPDVGSSWFLGRMPNRTGRFLGMTTTPMQAGDALWLNLADFHLPGDQCEAVFDALTTLDWQCERRADDSVLAEGLRAFEDGDATGAAMRDSAVFARQPQIARLTDAPDVAVFAQRLAEYAQADDWFAHGAKALNVASPTSLAVVYRQLHGEARLSVEQAFQRELAMAVQCTRHPDFAEGIRALLVDKDREPQWSPAAVHEVTPASIDMHFRLPGDYRRHPLSDLVEA